MMNREPLISVIVPIYNVDKYLEQCLSSLANQTYKNIEFLLIDDGSTDKSASICDKWANCDDRFKVFHIKNAGVSNARNLGLTKAVGNYIGFVDSDDWINHDMYEKMLSEMLKTESDICCGGYIEEFSNHQNISLAKYKAAVYTRNEALEQIFSCDVPKHTTWVLWDKLFKKEFVTNIRFTGNIVNGEDMLFLWQAMKSIKTFSLLPLYGYHYRMRPDSMVHTTMTKKHLTVIEAFKQVWIMSQNETKTVHKLINNYYMMYAITIGRKMLLLDRQSYENDIKEIQKYLRTQLINVFSNNLLTKRQIAGMFYICLPFRICIYLRQFI